MEVWHPDSLEPSPDDLKELERLKAFIEAAVADGKLSSSEMASIKAQAHADGKIAVEELELYCKLVLEKVAAGELEYEWRQAGLALIKILLWLTSGIISNPCTGLHCTRINNRDFIRVPGIVWPET